MDGNAAHEQAAVDNRLAVEEAKHAKHALVGQWGLAGGLKAYIDHIEPIWPAEYAIIEAA